MSLFPLVQSELLRVGWIEVRTIIKPHTATSSTLSSRARDPFDKDRWCTRSTFELDRPCLHSSPPYSRNVHVRVTERVDEHWGLKESDVGWYLLDVVEMKRDKGVRHSKR